MDYLGDFFVDATRGKNLKRGRVFYLVAGWMRRGVARVGVGGGPLVGERGPHELNQLLTSPHSAATLHEHM